MDGSSPTRCVSLCSIPRPVFDELVAREAREGDVVLLKASRGVKLEKALEIWQTKRKENGQ